MQNNQIPTAVFVPLFLLSLFTWVVYMCVYSFAFGWVHMCVRLFIHEDVDVGNDLQFFHVLIGVVSCHHTQNPESQKRLVLLADCSVDPDFMELLAGYQDYLVYM